MIKLRILGWGDFPGLRGGLNVVTRVLIRERGRWSEGVRVKVKQVRTGAEVGVIQRAPQKLEKAENRLYPRAGREGVC